MSLPPTLTTVTPLSKLMTVIVMFALPFIGFYFGRLYTTAQFKAMQAIALNDASMRKNASDSVVTAQSELNECIEALEREVKESRTGFEPGSVLVSFKVRSFDAAKGIIEKYGLSISETGSATTTFVSQRWFAVDVPASEEYRWACILQKDVQINHAGVNTLFNLRQ
jgi:hypothetical protein